MDAGLYFCSGLNSKSLSSSSLSLSPGGKTCSMTSESAKVSLGKKDVKKNRKRKKSLEERIKSLDKVLGSMKVVNDVDVSDVTSKPSSYSDSSLLSDEENEIFKVSSCNTSSTTRRTAESSDISSSTTKRGSKKVNDDKYRVDGHEEFDKYFSIGGRDSKERRSPSVLQGHSQSQSQSQSQEENKSTQRPARLLEVTGIVDSSKTQGDTRKHLRASSIERRQIHKYRTFKGLRKGRGNKNETSHVVGQAFKTRDDNFPLYMKRKKEAANHSKYPFGKYRQTNKYQAPKEKESHHVIVREHKPRPNDENNTTVTFDKITSRKFPAKVDQAKKKLHKDSNKEVNGKITPIKVLAPSYLAPGCEVKVNVDGLDITSVVPPEGIEKGQTFLISAPVRKASVSKKRQAFLNPGNKVSHRPPSILKNANNIVSTEEEYVKIQAPSYLPPDCEVKVTINGTEIKAKVPPEGIPKGGIFSILAA